MTHIDRLNQIHYSPKGSNTGIYQGNKAMSDALEVRHNDRLLASFHGEDRRKVACSFVWDHGIPDEEYTIATTKGRIIVRIIVV